MARAMKDSGIEWIGKIPETWSILALKYLCSMQAGKNLFSEQIADDGDYPVYGGNGLRGYFNNFNYEGTKLLVGRQGALCGNVHRVNKKFWATEHAIVTENTDLCHINFLYYLLIGMNLNQYVLSTAAQPGLAVSTIQNIRVCLPSLMEQICIATFLDTECARIDAVIEQTRASIEEYKKLKQAVITQAVTKGIRPGRKMKDSGVEWIGEIPDEWEICRLRHIGSTQNGISKSGEFFGEGYPFVSYGDVYRNMSLPHEVKGLVKSTEEEQELYSVRKGDIFFTRTSETIEEVGFSSVCEQTIPKSTFAGFLIRVRPYDDTLDIGFSKYYFRSGHHRFYLVKQMNLVTRASLGQQLLKGMPVLVPNNAEQKEIAEYLDKMCSKYDRLISAKETIISELETFKKSLIYEYVTGKKEVL